MFIPHTPRWDGWPTWASCPASGGSTRGFCATLGWPWWQPVLVGVTLVSLALTALDWDVAFAGVILNIAILALLWLGPRLTSWFSR